MKLISWNIQWARGADGVVDPARIVQAAQDLADFDVLCLQEVAAGFAEPGLAGKDGGNQFAEFGQLLPRYTAIPIAGSELPGPDWKRHVFGNLILSRLPVLRVLRHQLPWPADPSVRTMPRVMVEVTVESALGPVRIMNTHLEYYSQKQRAAQVEALRALHAEACGRSSVGLGVETRFNPYFVTAQTPSAILVGDFNLKPSDPLHARMQEAHADGSPRLIDAWQYLNPGQPHPDSVGLFDHEQWPEPFTCDFAFVTEDLLPHIKGLYVDQNCPWSDHQPLLLELA